MKRKCQMKLKPKKINREIMCTIGHNINKELYYRHSTGDLFLHKYLVHCYRNDLAAKPFFSGAILFRLFAVYLRRLLFKKVSIISLWLWIRRKENNENRLVWKLLVWICSNWIKLDRRIKIEWPNRMTFCVWFSHRKSHLVLFYVVLNLSLSLYSTQLKKLVS